jgi:predicted small lipoprotein YifL
MNSNDKHIRPIRNSSIKEALVNATGLVAMLVVIGLGACGQKTSLKPPATADVQPAVEKQVAVPGPAIPAGPGTGTGEKGDPDKPGDTVLVLPEKP